MTTLLENLRGNLKRVLEEKGLTQEELSVRADFHRSTVNKILSGDQNPSIPACERLANELDIPPHTLFEPVDD